VIRHLLALTGADPRKARLPAGKRKVRVHTQRIGEVRLITVAPMQGTLPEVETPALNDVCAPTDAVLLRGIVLAPPHTDTLWLTLEGAGAVPLLPASDEVDTTLRDLVQQRVVIRGACVAQGIAVETVQAVAVKEG